MPERLTPAEASLLALDTDRSPAQLGTLSICTADQGTFVEDQVAALLRDRIAYLPRYRQRVRRPAGVLTGAIWADDDDFDLSYHLQRLTVPRPGTSRQLAELVADLVSRRLDRSRPLWAAYVIEGVGQPDEPEAGAAVGRTADSRFALLSVSHLALVDGADTVELTQVLLDDEPQPVPTPAAPWRPAPEPAPLQLLGDTLVRATRDPRFAADTARAARADALGAAVALGAGDGGLSQAVGDLAEQALQRGRRVPSVLGGEVVQGRRLALASVPLADLTAVARRHQVTVHDVVLASVSGALRRYLLARGATLSSGRVLTALTPVAVLDEGTEPSAVGCQVASRLQRLPVGEPDAVVRLQLLGFGTRTHTAGGRGVAADLLADIAGFAPATLHALGLRAGADIGRPFDLIITNAPGPQQPRYLAGSALVASHPVLPLTAEHPLAVGVTSYDAQVFFGLTAAPAGPDVDVLVDGLEGSLAELVATGLSARTRR